MARDNDKVLDSNFDNEKEVDDRTDNVETSASASSTGYAETFGARHGACLSAATDTNQMEFSDVQSGDEVDDSDTTHWLEVNPDVAFKHRHLTVSTVHQQPTTRLPDQALPTEPKETAEDRPALIQPNFNSKTVPEKGINLTTRAEVSQTTQQVPQQDRHLVAGNPSRPLRVTQIDKCEKNSDAAHKAGVCLEVPRKSATVRFVS